MKKKIIVMAVSLLVMCSMILDGCKKSVGTPEDNAVQEETTEEETEGKTGYKFGFSAIDMENPYFITL